MPGPVSGRPGARTIRIGRSWFGRAFAAPLLVPVIAVLLAAASGCASYPAGSAAPSGPNEIVWQAIAPGIDLAEVVSLRPPLRVYCLKVDTGTLGVQIVLTPPDLYGEYPGRRTSTFLERFALTAAINGSPFRPVRLNEGLPTDVVGISTFRGMVVSPPEHSYDCLVRDTSGGFAIVSQADLPPSFDLAVGGFRKVLEKGAPVGSPAGAAGKEAAPVRHPRTGVGISRSGRILYFVIIDGRNPASSIGTTEAELAAWLVYFGAREGLNLDGGGSSTMVVADETGKGRIVNRPRGYGIFSMERVVANHLGITAVPDTQPPPR